MKRYLFALLCGTALACQATVAFAQAQLEEVVVTARKREESLMNVPVAVAAVSAEALKNGLASDLSKMSELAPQVSIGQGGSGTGATITVRGISSSSADAGLDQTVSVEIDGVPISRGQVVSTSLFDIGGVQVLQGPQALFFGKNSPAGVISIRSATPTNKFEGYMTAGYEFVALQKYFEGAINAPISDDLKTRFAFRGSKMDGWMKNVAPSFPQSAPSLTFPGGVNPFDPTVTVPGSANRRDPQEETWGARFSALWEPSDTFDAKFKIELNSQRRSSGGGNLEPFCLQGADKITQYPVEPFITYRGVRVTNVPGLDCNKDHVRSVGSVPSVYALNFPWANKGQPYAISRYILASLTLNKKFDNFSLTNTSGYFYQKYKQMNVSDVSPLATIWSASNEAYELIMNELRLNTDFQGAINGSTGVYFEHFDRPFGNAPDLSHFYNPVAQNYATVQLDSKNNGTYFSVFGQLRWNITPELELAGGARYGHDKKKTDMYNVSVGPLSAATLRPVGNHLIAPYSSNNVSPEATLSWHPAPGQTLYGAFKTGYKSGGISNPFLLGAAATPGFVRFKPERTIGGEIGYKANLMGNTLRVDTTAYRYTYKDLQVTAYDVTTISFYLRNAARARVQGIQGSAEWLAMDDLTLKGNFGFNDAKYLSFPGATCWAGQTPATGCNPIPGATGVSQDLSGKHLVRAPKLTFSLGVDYKAHFGGWDANFAVSGTHSSSFNADTNISPGGRQAAYWLLNASVRVGPEDGRYELAFIGRNLTNTYYVLQVNGWSGSGNNNGYFGYFNRPREAVIQATARF
jgi:outer membrane receptor protein involved in Fe transport